MKASSCFRTVFIGLICLCSSILVTAQTGWKTFTHEKYKYSISYPPDWEPKDMISYMGFVSPKENEKDVMMENVNVVVEDHKGKNVTLDQLADQSRPMIKELMGKDGKLTESKTTILGMPALKFDEVFETQGFHLHINQYFVIKNDVAYIFTYTAADETFVKYEATALKVIGTFQFPK